METDENFALLAETLPHMVWRTLPNGDHNYFNHHWYDYTGLDFEQSKAEGWSLILHPDDYERTLQVWQHSLETGEPYQIEYRFRNKNGKYRWFLGKALPARDTGGNILYWFGTCTDIHEQKKSEKALLHREHELTRMNQTLDNFVRIAAHDLKSPVASMQSLIELHHQYANQDMRNKVFDKLEDCVLKMSETLDSLQMLLRWKDEKKASATEMKLDELLQRVQDSLSFLMASKTITIHADFSQAEYFSYVEPYLFSILKNLLSNAIKYSAPEKDCIIEIKTQKQEKGIILTVSDNGIGIDLEKYGNKIFQSFERFTSQSGGTGLGLYLIKQMVEHNGGKIEVESQLDEGTTFRLELVEHRIKTVSKA